MRQAHGDTALRKKNLTLSEVRKLFADFPDVPYEEFLELKRIWGPPIPIPDEVRQNVDG